MSLFRAKIPPFVDARSALESLKVTEEDGVKTEKPDLIQLCNWLAKEVTDLSEFSLLVVEKDWDET